MKAKVESVVVTFGWFTLWASVALMFFALIHGCANFVAPKTLDQRMAYVYATNVSTRAVAADYVKRGRISKADGAYILEKTDEIEQSVAVARALLKDGKPDKALDWLTLAEKALKEAEKRLE